METERLVIVGAGGFGRETLDACMAAGIVVSGFLDDRALGQVRGLPVSLLDGRGQSGPTVVAVALPAIRDELVSRLVPSGAEWATVVDPRAVIGPESSVDRGSIVLASAFVSSSVQIAEHVQVNYGATIGHDTCIDSFSTILPGAHVAGNVMIGRSVLIGAGAVVLQGLEIGEGAVVGAGAVVTNHVAPGTTVVGVPARTTGE